MKDDDFYKYVDLSRLGKVIKMLREKQGINQDDFVRGICDRAFLSKLENGERKAPSIMVLVKICQRLNISIDDLFTIAFGDESLTTIVNDINAYIRIHNYEMAHLLADIHLKNCSNIIYRQFYLLEEAIYYLDKKDFDRVSYLVEEGIFLTTSFTGPLYTLTELRLVNIFLYVQIVHYRINDQKIVLDTFRNFKYYISLNNHNDYDVIGNIYLDCCYYYLICIKCDDFYTIANYCKQIFYDLKMHNHTVELWIYFYVYYLIKGDNTKAKEYYNKLKTYSKLFDSSLMSRVKENVGYFVNYTGIKFEEVDDDE